MVEQPSLLNASHPVYRILRTLGKPVSINDMNNTCLHWLVNPNNYHLFTPDAEDRLPDECSEWVRLRPGFLEDVSDLQPILADFVYSKWLLYSDILEEFFLWTGGGNLWHAGKTWVEAMEVLCCCAEGRSRRGKPKTIPPTLNGEEMKVIPWSKKKWRYSQL